MSKQAVKGEGIKQRPKTDDEAKMHTFVGDSFSSLSAENEADSRGPFVHTRMRKMTETLFC